MDYLRRFVLWLISGFGAALGVALVVWGYTEIWELKRKAEVEASLPVNSVAVTAVEPIAIPKELTVAAVLTNNAEVSVGVSLRLVVVHAGKVIFECGDTHAGAPAPGKSARVQVNCSGVERENVPAGATFEVRVSEVTPVR